MKIKKVVGWIQIIFSITLVYINFSGWGGGVSSSLDKGFEINSLIINQLIGKVSIFIWLIAILFILQGIINIRDKN